MSSSKKKSSAKSNDVDLASLVSSIKKNVGSSQPASNAPVPVSSKVSSSSSSKTKSKKQHEKKPLPELGKELVKKQKKVKPAESSDDDLPPPKERKRSRADIQEVPKEAAEEWDDAFEKDDIEDIFGKLKSSKEARAAAAKQAEEEEAALQKLLDRSLARSTNNSVAIRQSSVRRDPNRKYTEDGFPIYSTEELGLSTKGGDTELCPFDCECCH
jgi:hypothetical protein